MILFVTASGSIYGVHGRTMVRQGDKPVQNTHATAWSGVYVRGTTHGLGQMIGQPLRFEGWPGQMTDGGFSPFCARGAEDIITSRVVDVIVTHVMADDLESLV